MSSTNQLTFGPLIRTFRSLRNFSVFSNLGISKSQKVVILSVTASIALLGVLARYLRRRKTTSSTTYRKLKRNPQILHNPNGEAAGSGIGRRSGSPGIRSLHRQGSLLSGLSDRVSNASVSLSAGVGGPSGDVQAAQVVTPQQYGVMGMEALEISIKYWEDALDSYRSTAGSSNALALTSEEEAEFYRELERLLDAAYHLQGQCELLFLDQRSVLFRAESVSTRLGADSDLRTDYSSPESFVSAQDEVADLREFEEFADILTDIEKLPLYQSALKQFDDGGIPYRCLRTEMVHCSSDVEYLCKLHCIRLAFQWLFKDQNSWYWFADSGRQVLTDLMIFADKDPKDFLIAYEEMLKFLQEEKSWDDIETELSTKGVKAMTFYDIVLDYILMDAFEDLESPPSSVTAVVQNRWLSNGFKESALTTAVWSVLKTKKSMLKFPRGFMAHFYAISSQLSPLMAWGFLGPDETLKEMCFYFKEQVLEFLTDLFSFQKSRYSAVEELASDMFRQAKTRFANITHKLSTESQQSYSQLKEG